MSSDPNEWEDPEKREVGYLATLQREQIMFSKSLRGIKEGDDSELYFDRQTGRLHVAREGKEIPNDVIPATEMAKEGFFRG